MKTAYFDCQFGAAGDMLLGACLAAGLPLQKWLGELKKIALPENSYTVNVETVSRCTLASTKVSIITSHHGNGHGDGQGQAQDHSHDHDHEEERDLRAINHIIESSTISTQAKSQAKSIFMRLAQAEGKVHGKPAEDVHFHEIGAIDSMVDIIGFAIAFEMLEIEKCVVSPLPLGAGTVQTQHGIFPLPAPAVLELLKEAQAPIDQTTGRQFNFPGNHECLTPTGAAILAQIADAWAQSPQLDKIDAIGYGAGSFNPATFPNVCRLMLGEAKANSGQQRFSSEPIVVLETNLDDMSPQALAFTCEELFKEGALDVFVTACVMKKGRSGHLLTALCALKDSERLEASILLNTSTLGVRQASARRLRAEREWETVEFVDGGKIRIKIGRDLSGKIIHVQPEYEDCAESSRRTGLPLSQVYEEALAKYRQGRQTLKSRI